MRAPIVIFLVTLGQVARATCDQYPPPPPPPGGCKPQNPHDVTCFDAGVPQSSPINLQLPPQRLASDLSGIPSSFLLPQQQPKPLLPGPCPTTFPIWPQPAEEKCVRHIPVIQKYRNSLIETRTRHVPIIKKRFRTVVEPYTTHVPVLEKFCHPVEETVVRSVPVFEGSIRPLFGSPQPSPVAIKFPSTLPSQPYTLNSLPPSLTTTSCLHQPQPSPRHIPITGPISTPCGCSSYPSQPPCYSY